MKSMGRAIVVKRKAFKFPNFISLLTLFGQLYAKAGFPYFPYKQPSSSTGGEVPPKGFSPLPSSSRTNGMLNLADMTHFHENQLKKLSINLLALIQKSVKSVMKDVFDSLNNMGSRVYVVEGAFSSLRAGLRELKNRAPIVDPDLSFLDEAMAASQTTRGPIDELLAGLGENDEAEHDDDSCKDEVADDDGKE
ncbi:hypothetical protein HAX54_020199 [Datura stramonium]|uniref:Uncharacterized protein n=1 Tax=Datura stramonium TaxID=4076 RepID=A0ABS8UT16_DATST|nr:hypothetical protein [Datura stramonium]